MIPKFTLYLALLLIYILNIQKLVQQLLMVRENHSWDGTWRWCLCWDCSWCWPKSKIYNLDCRCNDPRILPRFEYHWRIVYRCQEDRCLSWHMVALMVRVLKYKLVKNTKWAYPQLQVAAERRLFEERKLIESKNSWWWRWQMICGILLISSPFYLGHVLDTLVGLKMMM